MTHKFEAFLYGIFFIFWTVRIYYKLYDKKVRKYVLSIGILIVFWMFIRMLKGIVGINALERYIWYLYYIPLIFIPTLFYICSCTNRINNKLKYLLYIVSTILFMLVITNDLHEIVFKFNNDLYFYDDYKHNIGYILIAIWIFYLLGAGMIKISLNRLKIKKDYKVLIPFGIILLGLIYTLLYVKNIPYIREINMSVVNSVLIFLGIESMFYLDLIPNNRKYIKSFKESYLDMMIVSLDSKTCYMTKQFTELPTEIINDIDIGKVKESYKINNIVYNVKQNSDSYVILKNDLSEFYKLERQINKAKKQLLKQQHNLMLEEKTKRKLYNLTTRKNIINKIETKLNEKREEAKEILNKKNISKKDLEKIKRIIIYSKKKSSLIIADLSSEIFNYLEIKNYIDELFKSMSSLNNNCRIVVKDNVLIDGMNMSLIYDIIYELLENCENKTMIFYLDKENEYLKLKVIIDGRINYNFKEKSIKYERKFLDTDTELNFKIQEKNL